ncbi:MAG: 3-dehydroquinate synthase [Clostridia bacterium]|nr:3-dehydroquinate synthase [Clostridia bacterium]
MEKKTNIKEIAVNAGRSYGVLIGKGLLKKTGELLNERAKAAKYCIVSDENVAPLYLDAIKAQVQSIGAEVHSVVFSAGEAHKTLETIGNILARLAEWHYTRTDCLIALGGGIVGDVCGFAASVYMRGIRFVQLPTTLLAAVDSSVGGKTGVNLAGLKNQVGAFWQPSLVICDPDTFGTLPEREMRNGMAEVIKYAAICAPGLADKLDGDITEIIGDCVQIKADIVSRDERDNGERMLLNYGHTFGHAVECASEERIPHGMAVAIGMMMACDAAIRLGVADSSVRERTAALLTAHGLPLHAPEYPAETLYLAMRNDKKRSGNTVTLVLPESFGRCTLHKVTMDELRSLMV